MIICHRPRLRSGVKSFLSAKVLLLIIVGLSLLFASSCGRRSGRPRILVFSKTSGFVHKAIPVGVGALQKLGREQGFLVDTTTNSAWFTKDSLDKYAAVVFLNTTGDVLNNRQEAAFEQYIQAGGGFVGIHSATDTEYDWRWYGRLVGAYFGDHPEIQQATLLVIDSNHAATKGLPGQWQRTDEWYNFKWIHKDIHPLLTIDEGTYRGGRNGKQHPVAWYHEYDGGRAFYTALGHTEESYSDPRFLNHLVGGIRYAIGDNSKLKYARVTTQLPPDDDRFVKVTLAEGTFSEPTEMTILPNLDVLVGQRKGEVMLYSQKNKSVKQAGFLNVYHKTNTPGVNAEEGLLGIAADPDFKNNRYIYIFYSPLDTSVNRLSRFELRNDTILPQSEKVVLQFYSQREICCHTGGSIAFGKDHLLYLSTGDNSTPFDEPNQPFVNHGFAPLNDVPGHHQYDARRSAGNTNDLRGKILRIKINSDGSYSIPDGNLFPPNTPNARPEIYVMGNRNPYRISVDKRKGFLYWGEVGPDSGVDSLDTRGPRGYDEINQARKAGFFGWPLFIGNNYAYKAYDYATGKSGDYFDPTHPVNNSRNNSGLQQLPPAQPAFIWYPYAPSNDFPQLGTGGRTAMAGPIYYAEDYPKETRYPDYYNGKLFIYEWMRNWIKAVTMQDNGDFEKMEPFIENAEFNAPIDMEMGPDGRLYVLEYGQGWFTQNPDAGLARIDYIAGNRPPKVDSLAVAKESGGVPFTLRAKVAARDPEKDALLYVWSVAGAKTETRKPEFIFTLKTPGEYKVSVEVFDDKKASNKSNEVMVYVGNERPEINIAIEGNRTFYFGGKPVRYSVGIEDKGDAIDTSSLFISSTYIEGVPVEEEKQGHQVVPAHIMGKNIMMSSDCKSCHKTEEKSIGPSFLQVAQRYRKAENATAYLEQKIIKGSSGVWGETAMPAHPTMKPSDAQQIAHWILSLAETKSTIKSLPARGSIMPKATMPKDHKNVLALSANYTDRGGRGVGPLSTSKTVHLRSNQVDVSALAAREGFDIKDSSGIQYLLFPEARGWVKLMQVDLNGIKNITVNGFGTEQPGSYQIEIRIDHENGKKIGEGQLSLRAGKQKSTLSIPLQPAGDNRKHDLYIVSMPLKPMPGNRALLKTLVFMQ